VINMNRIDIIEMLNSLQMQYSITEHPPVDTIEDIDNLQLSNAEVVVKNLFLRDDKKRNFYLVVLRKDKTANIKELRRSLGTRPLSFASEDDLLSILGLTKGAVTPLGILNDNDRKVQVIIDEDILRFPIIGVHPNENTATLWLSPQDLQKLIKNHGNSMILIKI